jgi:EAL domain-containing protein (putative c-di-GMP-specific phosphodiesterase class I)
MVRRRSQAGRLTGVLRKSLGLAAPTDRSGSPATLRGIAYTWNLNTDTLTWGPQAAEVLGVARTDLPQTGEAFSRLFEPGSGSNRLAAILTPDVLPSHPAAYETSYTLRLGPDRTCPVEDSGRWISDAQGRPALAQGVLCLKGDGGSHDLPSTLIRARSALLGRIQEVLSASRAPRSRMTLIVGRLEGDDGTDVLMDEVAGALRPLLRRGDHLDIYAPAAFALILASCTAADAESAMTRALRLVEARSVVLGENLRLGAASAPEHAVEAVSLLRQAERALASATADGLRFATAYAVRVPAAPACGTDPFDVVDALNGRRLVHVGRPLVDALTRQTVFHEALPRLARPDGTSGPAEDLAAVMDRPGLSLLLDGRLLERVADELAASPRARVMLPIAGATVREAEWIDMLAAHLGARPGIASRLTIGLASASLTDVDGVRGRLDAMKALGVGLAAHGFGTGHLTGRHLRHLPIDLLKLDGAFIQVLGRSPEERLYVRTLIECAHRLGMATAAEWVEDERTARLLAAWGVDYLQGGLFRDEDAGSASGDGLHAARA